MGMNQFQWTLKLYLFMMGSINTFVVSYYPIYFKYMGLTTSEIGSVLALGGAVGLLGQPLWGILSDKFQTVKKLIMFVLVGSIIGIIWIFQVSTLTWIFVAASFFYLFYTSVFPLSENLTKRIATEHQLSFGTLRSWAAWGFAFITLVSGFFFAKLGIQYLLYPVLLFAILAFILATRLTDAPTGTKKINLRAMGKFFRSPTLLFFFAVTSFLALTHRINDNYISLYLIDIIGGDETLVGWLWFIGVLSEAIMFYTSAIWFRPQKPIHYVILAGFLYFIRWLIVGYISDPLFLLAIQVLHGVCYAILFMGAIEYLYKLVPEEMQATGCKLLVIWLLCSLSLG
ncbi:hypothetical protein ACA29_15165 [Lederbergia galactosidilytica]|uniref:Major facilitator superfamily associated domain-containing protein n=1 Tax=Lederbergia galactosidilytica TaxID=217031 RepID=A0A0Q9XSU9_9BACI|nr:hypothetical protein ACA29_15165 [Lederbergia galactosidilytica]